MEGVIKLLLNDIFSSEQHVRHDNFSMGTINIRNYTTLNFTNKGELTLHDDLFFARWNTEDNIFTAQTDYLTKPVETITSNLASPISSVQQLDKFANDVIQTSEGEFCSPYHKNNHIELYYIVEGEFKLKVQEEKITLYAGEGLLLDRNTLHSDYICKKPSKIIIIGISQKILDETLIRDIDEVGLLKFLKLALVKDKTKSEYITFKPSRTKEKIELLLLSLFQEIKEKDFGYTYIIKGIISRLLNILTLECDYYLVKSKQKLHKQLLFDEIEKYIELNFRDVKLKDLVDKFNYTEDYFNRIIKEITGLTYTQYVQEIRLDHAASLLLTTSLPVQEIALEVGYRNIHFFYQIFTSKYLVTPKQYRINMNADQKQFPKQ